MSINDARGPVDILSLGDNMVTTSTAAQKFAYVFSCGVLEFSLFASSEQPIQVLTNELPLGGLGHRLIMILEPEDAGFDLLPGAAVVGAEHLPPQDREVDLDG